MNACPEYEILLERFGDGEAAADESLRVREHLAECSRCRAGLRSITDLNRRVAQSPAPPAPAGLEDRLRRALRGASPARRFRAWIPAAAGVAGAAIVLMILRASPARADIPSFVAASAAVHDSYLSGAASLGVNTAVAPVLDEIPCVGGCLCSIEDKQVPWIVYRRGGTPVSLILVDKAPPHMPAASRRSIAGRGYHAFQAGPNSVIVCRTEGGAAHVWISRLPQEELAACAVEAREKRDAFSGERLSIRGIGCRACCAGVEARAKKVDGVSDARVSLESMELILSGRKRLDVHRIVRELREAGLDVVAK